MDEKITSKLKMNAIFMDEKEKEKENPNFWKKKKREKKEESELNPLFFIIPNLPLKCAELAWEHDNDGNLHCYCPPPCTA